MRRVSTRDGPERLQERLWESINRSSKEPRDNYKNLREETRRDRTDGGVGRLKLSSRRTLKVGTVESKRSDVRGTPKW